MKPVSGANYDNDPIVGGMVYPEARKIHAGVGDEGAMRRVRGAWLEMVKMYQNVRPSDGMSGTKV
jgi:hypothetical protein